MQLFGQSIALQWINWAFSEQYLRLKARRLGTEMSAVWELRDLNRFWNVSMPCHVNEIELLKWFRSKSILSIFFTSENRKYYRLRVYFLVERSPLSYHIEIHSRRRCYIKCTPFTLNAHMLLTPTTENKTRKTQYRAGKISLLLIIVSTVTQE